tara:strand:+ start:521 stop:727 length:207 start_codon:yes stop_codon:yes gene_type:complete
MQPHDCCRLHLFLALYGGTIPNEGLRFSTPVDPISPPGILWWRRRVPPPGPVRLLIAPFIVIVKKITI